jgi:hypothetical protein
MDVAQKDNNLTGISSGVCYWEFVSIPDNKILLGNTLPIRQYEGRLQQSFILGKKFVKELAGIKVDDAVNFWVTGSAVTTLTKVLARGVGKKFIFALL